jgi:DNA replication protein DnaC
MQRIDEISNNFLKEFTETMILHAVLEEKPKIARRQPKRFDKIDTKTPKIMQELKKYYETPVGFLLMKGPNGTGKSFCAEVIYQQFTEFVLPDFDLDKAGFMTQAELNQKWMDNGKDNKDFLNRILNCRMFVLDDLGTRPPSEPFLNFLYIILDHRWRMGGELATIVTTNRSADEISKWFGEAILSRIASGRILKFEGQDRRMIYDF